MNNNLAYASLDYKYHLVLAAKLEGNIRKTENAAFGVLLNPL